MQVLFSNEYRAIGTMNCPQRAMGYLIGPCLQGPTERLGKWDILWVTECMGYYRYGLLELTTQLYCILE